MNKYKFPLRVPPGITLFIQQPFKSTELAAFYASKGIDMKEHNGVDVTCGDGVQTFGSACVWPFPWPGTVYFAGVDSPVGATKNARAQIDGQDPVSGWWYSLVYLHLSAIEGKQTYAEGETIGYIGNNGAVVPAPTIENPFGGSHLHLGVGIKKPGESNYTMVDPMDVFTLEPFRGADDPTRDNPVYEWVAHAPFTKDLYMGLTNNDVLRLQKWLNAHGYPVAKGTSPGALGYETKYFGKATRAAVAAYQAAKGIKPTEGYFGAITRKSVNDSL